MLGCHCRRGDGQFHVGAVGTIGKKVEVLTGLTGMEARQAHEWADRRLQELAQSLRLYDGRAAAPSLHAGGPGQPTYSDSVSVFGSDQVARPTEASGAMIAGCGARP